MTSKIKNVRIAGIACAVPKTSRTAFETAAPLGMSEDETQKVVAMTGVQKRHIAHPSCCTSDLSLIAAQRLMQDLNWAPETIDALLFVSQTADYHLPNTACILQHRLGLPKSCAAFDIPLGCSGYTYGLWSGSGMIATGAKRVLLLIGDTSERGSHPEDKSTVFLFGDTGTATGLEYDETAPEATHVLGTDGSGWQHLCVPDSGCRHRSSVASFEAKVGPDGNPRRGIDLHMDGAEVFAFTLREVPPMMKTLFEASGWTVDDMEAFIPHQANLFMLQHLGKRMKIPKEKLLLSIAEFGNTSSASIPLTMNLRMADQLRNGPVNVVMAGFGVGWSWAAVATKLGPIVMPDIIYVDTENLPSILQEDRQEMHA